MTEPHKELLRVVKKGFFAFGAEDVPTLVALAQATFGDPPTTSGVRSRIRRGMSGLAPAYEDAAKALFGMIDSTAGLPLGARRRIAGETAGLDKTQAESTVRSRGGLEDQLTRQLGAYFEDGPEVARGSVNGGRGYDNTSYRVLLTERTHSPIWDLATEFSVEAYRHDVELVTLGLNGRREDVVSVEVTSPGHSKVGTRPAIASDPNGPLQLVIGLDVPLPVGIPVSFSVSQEVAFDASDPDCSLGINIARFPTSIELVVDIPLERTARHYSRVHEIRQVNNRELLSSPIIERSDDAPMTIRAARADPHTRYAVRWQARRGY